MAVAILSQFNQLYFSADLPDKVLFATQDANESAEVMVYVDHTCAFKTRLYAFGNDITLYDIRSIIEDAIRSGGYCYGECSVGITDGIHPEYSRDFYVIRSDISVTNSGLFLAGRFLTTRTSFRIHRAGTQQLTWFSAFATTIHNHIEAVIQPPSDTKPIVARWDEGRTQQHQGVQYYYELSTKEIADHFKSQGKLLSFTVHRGTRAMTFYVTDERPSITLRFRNNFNCWEYAELYAVTTKKQKVERSEAHCLRDRIFYDLQSEQTHEVETAALTTEEAHWLNQLFVSREVQLLLPNNTYRPILITDSTSEISDSNNHQNRHKFTWKFAKNIQHEPYTNNAQYFTEEYQPQYQ